MSMTLQTEETMLTDDTSLSTQMTAFTAQHKQQMATTRRHHEAQLKQYQPASADNPPPQIGRAHV